MANKLARFDYVPDKHRAFRANVGKHPWPKTAKDAGGGKVRLPGKWFYKWVGPLAHAMLKVIVQNYGVGKIDLSIEWVRKRLGEDTKVKPTFRALALLRRSGILQRMSAVNVRTESGKWVRKVSYVLYANFADPGDYPDLVLPLNVANLLVNQHGWFARKRVEGEISLVVEQ